MNMWIPQLKIRHHLQSLKKIKLLGITLITYVQDLYDENYTILMKELKEDLSNWRDRYYSWNIQQSKDINSLEIDTWVNIIPIKMSAWLFL